MKRLIVAFTLCAMMSLAHGQIYNPPQMPAWASTNPAVVRTNLGLGATNSVTFAGITNTGDTVLGDAVGDSVTVNAGTFTAPNATNTSATSVANVGALDGRYAKRKYSAYKPTVTYRNNTATLADDPDLVFADVRQGVYRVTLFLMVYGDTNTGGFKWQIGGSATMNSLHRATATPDMSSATFGNGQINLPLSGQSIAAWGNANRYSVITFTLNVTTPGSIQFMWAQNASDSGNCQFYPGSFFILDPM